MRSALLLTSRHDLGFISRVENISTAHACMLIRDTKKNKKNKNGAESLTRCLPARVKKETEPKP